MGDRNRADAVRQTPEARRASGDQPAMRRAMAGALAMAAAPLLGGAATASRVHSIVIDKMAFGAVPPDVRVGDTILWINKDLFRHTATARDGSFNVDLPAGKSGRTMLRRTGTIRFYCVNHPCITVPLVGAARPGRG